MLTTVIRSFTSCSILLKQRKDAEEVEVVIKEEFYDKPDKELLRHSLSRHPSLGLSDALLEEQLFTTDAERELVERVVRSVERRIKSTLFKLGPDYSAEENIEALLLEFAQREGQQVALKLSDGSYVELRHGAHSLRAMVLSKESAQTLLITFDEGAASPLIQLAGEGWEIQAHVEPS